MKSVRLRPGKERSALRRHPWIFEGSVAGGKADAGETVRVEDSTGRFLAWAAYSPLSSIRLRAWSFDEGERIDAAFFARRIGARGRRARALADRERRRAPDPRRGRRPARADRRSLRRPAVGAIPLRRRRALEGDDRRCIAGEDGRAAASTSAATRRRARAKGSPRRRAGCGRRPAPARARPRSRSRARLALRDRRRDRPQDRLLPRPARQPEDLRRHACATSRLERVLNCYCYTGGFSVAALAGGAAHVTAIDSSAPALARAADNVARNGFDAGAARARRCRRQRAPARVPRGAPLVRRDRPRSAQARADARPMPSAPHAPTRTSTASR